MIVFGRHPDLDSRMTKKVKQIQEWMKGFSLRLSTNRSPHMTTFSITNSTCKTKMKSQSKTKTQPARYWDPPNSICCPTMFQPKANDLQHPSDQLEGITRRIWKSISRGPMKVNYSTWMPATWQRAAIIASLIAGQIQKAFWSGKPKWWSRGRLSWIRSSSLH